MARTAEPKYQLLGAKPKAIYHGCPTFICGRESLLLQGYIEMGAGRHDGISTRSGTFFRERRLLFTYNSGTTLAEVCLDRILTTVATALGPVNQLVRATRIHHLQLDGVIPGWKLAPTGNWQVRSTKRNLGSYIAAVD